MTALHHGAILGDLGVVSFLVEFGCNVYSMDNDTHSAIDLAGMNNKHEIVRYLDNDLARRQIKNPKHAARQKEKALRKAEENLKLFEKMQDAATKRRDKEQKKRNKEIEKKLNNAYEANTENNTSTQKMSFFKTLTLRGKNPAKGQNGHGSTGGISSSKDTPWSGTGKYSDFAGTATMASRKGGIVSKIQKKQTEASLKAGAGAGGTSGFKSVRSARSDHGFVGPTKDIMYVGSVHGTGVSDGKRQSLTSDVFQKSKIYKARSEPDLLDSGIDSFNGDFDDNNNHGDDDDDAPGMFNRPEFGKLAFFQKNNFLGTLQSLEDEKSGAHTNNSAFPESQRLSGDGEEGDKRSVYSDASASKGSSVGSRTSKPISGQSDHELSPQLPWDQEDLGNLDDDDDEYDDETSKEMSALYMFLWSCDLARLMPVFTREKIDLALLMRMTDADMKEIGLEFGPRKRLREAITKRQEALSSPRRAMQDTYL
ncbi:usher syndrome type-1G-like protein [Elysia marginata]|uniref:Usher syndrome type-1G-like protein n=1 Tax=Elysia marginata TaxID=1093978 RepID=A0AAV4IJC5_9GAST|nr:usher syndrome type-1G-like protein [Elysia marginata]